MESVVDFTKRRKSKTQEIDEIIRNKFYTINIELSEGKYNSAINKMEKLIKEYPGMSITMLAHLYRNISASSYFNNDLTRISIYSEKIKTIIDYHEDELKQTPNVYIAVLNEYLETNKHILSKKKLIEINKKIMKVSKENKYTTDYIVSKANISFLSEDYDKVIDLLGDIHNHKFNIDQHDIDEIIISLEEELKEENIKFYQKYKKDISLNKSIAL